MHHPDALRDRVLRLRNRTGRPSISIGRHRLKAANVRERALAAPFSPKMQISIAGARSRHPSEPDAVEALRSRASPPPRRRLPHVQAAFTRPAPPRRRPATRSGRPRRRAPYDLAGGLAGERGHATCATKRQEQAAQPVGAVGWLRQPEEAERLLGDRPRRRLPPPPQAPAESSIRPRSRRPQVGQIGRLVASDVATWGGSRRARPAGSSSTAR